MKFQNLKQFYISTTTATVADQPLLDKPINRFTSKYVFPMGFSGEGVYFEHLDRRASQFGTAESTFRATGITTNIVSIRISDTRGVVAYSYNSKCYARIVLISAAGAITFGTEDLILNAAVTDISLCRLSNTSFAIAFYDDSSYLVAFVNTFNSAGAITTGTKKTLVSTAMDTGNGTAICSTNTNVIAVAHMLAGDDHLDIISAVYNGTVIATPGSVTEIAGVNAMYPSMVSHVTDKITVIWHDADDSGALCARTATVVQDLVTAEGARTELTADNASSLKLNLCGGDIVVTWIESGDAYAIAATVSSAGVIAAGTELVLFAGTVLTVDSSEIQSDEFISVYETTAISELGQCTLFTKKDITLTLGETDIFALTQTKVTSVFGLGNEWFVACFQDDADTNNIGKAILGKVTDHVVDIRSNVASATAKGWYVSLRKAKGLGIFAGYKIEDTSGSTDLAMSTKPQLPARVVRDYIILYKDEGMYTEDDGTVHPRKSGVDGAVGTQELDVRSQVGSQDFICYVMKIAAKPMYISGITG